MTSLEQPVIKLRPDGVYRELVKNFTMPLDDEVNVFVPQGFIFDFASVPKPLWVILPPAHGRYIKAAFIHDWFYSSQNITRYQADKYFLSVMKKCNVPFIKRQLLYWGVRIGGWVAWGAKGNDVIDKWQSIQRHNIAGYEISENIYV